MGITPSFSPLRGSEKREKDSRISDSWEGVMLCSLASLEARGLGVEVVVVEVDVEGALRLPDWRWVRFLRIGSGEARKRRYHFEDYEREKSVGVGKFLSWN